MRLFEVETSGLICRTMDLDCLECVTANTGCGIHQTSMCEGKPAPPKPVAFVMHLCVHCLAYGGLFPIGGTPKSSILTRLYIVELTSLGYPPFHDPFLGKMIPATHGEAWQVPASTIGTPIILCRAALKM